MRALKAYDVKYDNGMVSGYRDDGKPFEESAAQFASDCLVRDLPPNSRCDERLRTAIWGGIAALEAVDATGQVWEIADGTDALRGVIGAAVEGYCLPMLENPACDEGALFDEVVVRVARAVGDLRLGIAAGDPKDWRLVADVVPSLGEGLVAFVDGAGAVGIARADYRTADPLPALYLGLLMHRQNDAGSFAWTMLTGEFGESDRLRAALGDIEGTLWQVELACRVVRARLEDAVSRGIVGAGAMVPTPAAGGQAPLQDAHQGHVPRL